MTLKQTINDLQRQINDLKKDKTSKKTPFTTSITHNPFNRLEQIKLETGTTGSARYRRLHLPWIKGGVLSINTSGDLRFIGFHYLSSSAPETVQYGNPVVPSDCIEGGFPTLKILYSARTGGDNFDVEIFTLASLREGETDTILLYSELGSYTTYTLNSVADTLAILSYDLTLPPKSGDAVGCTIGRDGANDDNGGFMDIWSVWIEYLAYN